jgi:hypothetical protein
MKKLRKLDLDIMERELQALNERENEMVTGGIGIENMCYFYCLEYVSSMLNCGRDMSYYVEAYAKQYGLEEATTGVAPEHAEAFFNSMFSSVSIGAGTVNIGFFDVGASNGNTGGSSQNVHAVILTGVNESGDWTYYDPSTGQYGAMSSSSFIGHLGASGCL